jgi:ectoine hydroxylase-related dioxygenase (phytanoyl-CoA dioxygenase family)
MYEFISSRYSDLKNEAVNHHPNQATPVVGICRKIMDELEASEFASQLYHSENLLNCLENFLGPDLAKINANGLFVNDPSDDSPVTNKSFHQEIWTGASPDDMTVWIPFHTPEEANTLAIVPGSHFYGILPNRNRQILPLENFSLPEPLPIVHVEPGDAVLFHSMLVHKTMGRGSKVRYAMHFVMKNTHAPLSEQQRAFGFIGVRQGPMTKIRHVLGNDYFTPLRTYGGKISNREDY